MNRVHSPRVFSTVPPVLSPSCSPSGCSNDLKEKYGANNVTPLRVKKISSALQDKLKLTEAHSIQLTHTIIQLQKNLAKNQAKVIPASDTLPFEIVIAKCCFWHYINHIGKGTYSDVYKADIFPTVRHILNNGECVTPSKPLVKAVKQTKEIDQSFSPEAQRLAKVSSKFLDESLATFKEAGGKGYSINELFDSSLYSFDFCQFEHPVAAILEALLCSSHGLKAMHAAGLIHRDIKGENVLVKTVSQTDSEEQNSKFAFGVVTDFGLADLPAGRRHTTTGTPCYLDPSLFGKPEESLLNQIRRRGEQKDRNDVFAFGIMIIKDVLAKYLLAVSKGTSVEKEVEKIIKTSLKPERVTVPGYENDPISIPEKAPVQEEKAPIQPEEKKVNKKPQFDIINGKQFVILPGYENQPIPVSAVNTWSKRAGQRKMYIDGKIFFKYPAISEMREKSKEACRLLTGILSEDDIKALMKLADLGCDAQEYNENRPNSDAIGSKLTEILLELTEAKGVKSQIFKEVENDLDADTDLEDFFIESSPIMPDKIKEQTENKTPLSKRKREASDASPPLRDRSPNLMASNINERATNKVRKVLFKELEN